MGSECAWKYFSALLSRCVTFVRVWIIVDDGGENRAKRQVGGRNTKEEEKQDKEEGVKVTWCILQ